ncbi:uncharacterized protein LOC133311878 isoform X2 [Gastrolobium bilobum]|nr:uncharacterized protein LOC133311878 isoform X2 [Gastrolobium bilobum]
MLIYGSSVPFQGVGLGGIESESNWRNKELTRGRGRSITCKSLSRGCSSYGLALTSFLTAGVVIASVATAEPETLSNIPQTLSGECTSAKDCKKARIQKPKSRKAESCTIKCVTTCIRGGEGSPGEGPLNVTRPLVVFKQGFRTRQY